LVHALCNFILLLNMSNNRVTHFEVPCNDPEKTINFFANVFGWTFQKLGEQEYWIAFSGDEKTPGINGAIMQKRDPAQPIVNSIKVEKLDNTIFQIPLLGGTIVVPKTAVPGVGYLAYFKDPDGNIHGIWEEDKTVK
jgi:predicted enzyme related to lactoylglutathione lyase